MNNIFSLIWLHLESYPVVIVFVISTIMFASKVIFNNNLIVVLLLIPQYLFFHDYLNFLIENRILIKIQPISEKYYYLILLVNWFIFTATILIQSLICSSVLISVSFFIFSLFSLFKNVANLTFAIKK